MSGIYQIPFTYTGNSLVDLVSALAASGKPLIILGFLIGQKSDFGDANEEGIELIFRSGQTSAGSGGAASTPVNNDGSGGSASLTARAADTTKASGGTIVERGKYPWNIRVAYDKMFTEYEQILIPAGVRFSFEINSAPADSLTIFGHVLVQEIG